MTAVGINDILVTNLSVLATGVARDFADKTAFQAGGYDFTWYDEDGVALASQPTWDQTRSETNGDHFFYYEVPLGAFSIRLTVPATDYASVALWTGRGTSYGIDDLGGMIASTGSVTLTPTVTSADAEMFDGDSIDVSMSVTEAALTSIGAASLAACDTVRAYIKLDSTNSGAAPTVDYTSLTTAITSDTSGNRVVRVTANAFPAAIAIGDSAKSLSCKVMLELGEGSKLIIASVVNLTVKWVSRNGPA